VISDKNLRNIFYHDECGRLFVAVIIFSEKQGLGQTDKDGQPAVINGLSPSRTGENTL